MTHDQENERNEKWLRAILEGLEASNSAAEIKAQNIFTASATISDLQRRLEYAYRCINFGFDHGSFDFSVLRKDARDYVLGIEATENNG